MVYEDALKYYEDISATGTRLRAHAFKELVQCYKSPSAAMQGVAIFNPTSWVRRDEIVEVNIDSVDAAGLNGFLQMSADASKGLLIASEIGAYSIKTIDVKHKPEGFVPVKVNSPENTSTIVENAFIKVTFDKHGRLLSLIDKKENRETVAPGMLANVFKIFEDIPLFWDAWDVEVYHLEKGWDAGVGNLEVLEKGPLRAILKVQHPISKTSSLIQHIIVSAVTPIVEFDTQVKWNENRRFLKVEFPLNVSHDVATYETQFGFIQRPTHYNSSWDLARFEVCGHKFADLSEYGYGVALLNDCKYGYAVHGNVMRLSLLRSPKAPDLHADIGEHTFRYALYPHKGTFAESDVVRAGYEFNVPLLVSPSSIDSASPLHEQFFKLDKPNVILDTIKVAEDSKSGKDIVLRFYEAYGGRATVKIQSTLPIKHIRLSNVMEDDLDEIRFQDGTFSIDFTPFKAVAAAAYKTNASCSHSTSVSPPASSALAIEPPPPPAPYEPSTSTIALVESLPLVKRLRKDPDFRELGWHDAPFEGMVLKREHWKAHFIRETIYGDEKIEHVVGFRHASERAVMTIVKFGAHVTGHPGIVHGGLIAALFDDLMGTAFFADAGGRRTGFTANLTVDYRSKMESNRCVAFIAWIEREEGRKVWCRAEARGAEMDEKGVVPGEGGMGVRLCGKGSNLYTEGKALFIIVPRPGTVTPPAKEASVAKAD
ncbi:Alpha-mannosidase 2C1 [Borealophlyctis nickersoniae]|nr:Alpha-mannosidase 2C1 [Borealophlyctis nickersoniae]